MQSYDYAKREDVFEPSWDEIAGPAARVAEGLAEAGVEVNVGVARAGLIPATLVATGPRRELYPVRADGDAGGP